MILAEQSWKEIENLSREVVVLIPTGALEQHGTHLPLFTDSILAGAVASGVEARLPDKTLLTPTLWLGASAHHLRFPGTLSASFGAYEGAIVSIVESLQPHGFYKFFVVNGHGGNTDPNGIALRSLKAKYPKLMLGHADYYKLAEEGIAAHMEGPAKGIAHADEAEASMILHLRPELVHRDRLRHDGLWPEPPIQGMVHHFDERSDEGSIGDSHLATAEKGKAMLEASIDAMARNIEILADGYVLKGSKSEGVSSLESPQP